MSTGSKASASRFAVFEESDEVRQLANAYLDAKVVGRNSHTDALHVAYATLYRCDGLVSWNFKHMVRPDKALMFNMANAALGLSQLFIATPKEVLDHERK